MEAGERPRPSKLEDELASQLRLTRCPYCHDGVGPDDANVVCNACLARHHQDCWKEGSRCGSCGSGAPAISPGASARTGEKEADAELEVPAGAWLYSRGQDVVVGASTRSLVALYLVPFTMLWAGGVLRGIVGLALEGEFDTRALLFAVPFGIAALILILFALMTVAGRVEVTRKPDGELVVFRGVGPFGVRKRLAPGSVSKVREGGSSLSYTGRQSEGLTLEGRTKFTFGTLLNVARVFFLQRTLRRLLSPSLERE